MDTPKQLPMSWMIITGAIIGLLMGLGSSLIYGIQLVPPSSSALLGLLVGAGVGLFTSATIKKYIEQQWDKVRT